LDVPFLLIHRQAKGQPYRGSAAQGIDSRRESVAVMRAADRMRTPAEAQLLRQMEGDHVPDPSTVNATILVLGSEPVVRLVLKETLESGGYTVLATEDVGKAADLLNQSLPDLLIVHPYVEGLPGLEAAKYLKTKCPTMNVLMLAGLIDDDRIENPAALQGFRVFPRPFTAAQLHAEIKEVLNADPPQNAHGPIG